MAEGRATPKEENTFRRIIVGDLRISIAELLASARKDMVKALQVTGVVSESMAKQVDDLIIESLQLEVKRLTNGE